MKNFLRAYNYTLVPVVGVFIALCSVYIHLTQGLVLDKALKLGTIYGFFIGLVSNVLAASLLLWKIKHKAEQEEKAKEKEKIKIQKEKPKVSPTRIPNNAISHIVKEMYLLVDKDMAFDISLQTIIDYALGKPTETNKHRGVFSVRTKDQTIDFEIQPLTRHTAKLNIKSQKQNEVLSDIIRYIKERESSLLSY